LARSRPITGLDLQAPTAKNARLIVRARLAEMYAYTEYVGSPEHVQELHDLRIAAKRVRYTLEVFADYLPAASQGFAEELATLQDELGALHDSEVMLALLRLSLHKEQQDAANEYTAKQPLKPLLSAQMAAHITRATDTHAPEEKAQQGLASFLLKQEQRRIQSYEAFRLHWEQLEQRHFRAKLLEMLADDEEKK
jgi:hypothetical protein